MTAQMVMRKSVTSADDWFPLLAAAGTGIPCQVLLGMPGKEPMSACDSSPTRWSG